MPDRQSRLQPKFGERRDVRLELRIAELERVEPHDAAIFELEFFGKMIEHDPSPQRRRQRCNQKAVIAARACARDRP